VAPLDIPTQPMIISSLTCIYCAVLGAFFFILHFTVAIEKKIELAIYADDHIFSVDSTLVSPVSGKNFGDYESRRLIYQQYGIVLAKDKDLVTDSLEGHTFLGLKIQWSTRYNRYVPIFDPFKAINSIQKQEKKSFTPDQKWTQALSLAHLCVFHEWSFSHLTRYLHFLREEHPILRQYQVPSQEYFENYWFCGEMEAPKKCQQIVPTGFSMEEEVEKQLIRQQYN